MATILILPTLLRHERRKYVWEFPIRLTHWVNAIAIAVLFLTGLSSRRQSLRPVAKRPTTS